MWALKNKRSLTTFPLLLRDAFREFQLNDPLRMAAATAFFASFALPPILIILSEVFGFFGDPRTIRHDLFEQLGNVMDKKTVLQVRETLRNIHYLSLSWGMKVGGFIFLLFVASTLFTIIKNSLNQLWKIKLKKRERILSTLLYRAKSIGIIIIAGLLFFVVVLADTKGWLLQKFFFHLVSLLAVMTWFMLILRYLADGRTPWKIAVGGGIFTGLLFTLGKALLHFLLSFNKVQTIYGASTALVLLLLFIFYSSFIFYYGACFTKSLADYFKQPILPTRNAVRYTLESIEWEPEGLKEH